MVFQGRLIVVEEIHVDKFMFVIHVAGVALAVGTGFAILALKAGSADMRKAEREPYMLRGFVVTNIGALGIVFVLVSGLVMFFQDSEALIQKGGPFLWVKIVLFVLYLIVFMTLRQRVSKARVTNGAGYFIGLAILPTIASARADSGCRSDFPNPAYR